MKKVLELIIKEPITTVQGLLYAFVGVLSFYEAITIEEGSLWAIFLLAVFKLFSRDNSFKNLNETKKNDDTGGGGLGAIKPKKP